MQVIHGKCPSKSNCYRIVKNVSGYGLSKTEVLKRYEYQFYLQCDQYRNKNINGLFEINLKVYYPNNRPDLDNSLKIILDCLQSCKAIKNDRNCVRIVAEKFIDKNDPRIEFDLIPI